MLNKTFRLWRIVSWLRFKRHKRHIYGKKGTKRVRAQTH